MRVTAGQAKTDFSRLLERVEAGERIEIARNGIPVARLVPIDPAGPGAAFIDSHGARATSIAMADDFEFSDEELDRIVG